MTKINVIFRRSLVGIFLLLGTIGAQAATLTVDTTADAGVGSLRQALQVLKIEIGIRPCAGVTPGGGVNTDRSHERAQS